MRNQQDSTFSLTGTGRPRPEAAQEVAHQDTRFVSLWICFKQTAAIYCAGGVGASDGGGGGPHDGAAPHRRARLRPQGRSKVSRSVVGARTGFGSEVFTIIIRLTSS